MHRHRRSWLTTSVEDADAFVTERHDPVLVARMDGGLGWTVIPARCWSCGCGWRAAPAMLRA